LPQLKPKAAKKTASPKDAASGKAAPIGHLAQMLDKLGLRNDWDFILHLPLRYEDETRITKVSDYSQRNCV
jgi:ATP-dependent DNA helicase RecG